MTKQIKKLTHTTTRIVIEQGLLNKIDRRPMRESIEAVCSELVTMLLAQNIKPIYIPKQVAKAYLDGSIYDLI